MTDADLMNALRDCYDTLLQRNVVAAGLVERATVELDREAPGANVRGVAPRYRAQIALRAPGTDEARNTQLCAQVENRLAGMASISRAEVHMLPALFPILNPQRP